MPDFERDTFDFDGPFPALPEQIAKVAFQRVAGLNRMTVTEHRETASHEIRTYGAPLNAAALAEIDLLRTFGWRFDITEGQEPPQAPA